MNTTVNTSGGIIHAKNDYNADPSEENCKVLRSAYNSHLNNLKKYEDCLEISSKERLLEEIEDTQESLAKYAAECP